MEVTLFKHLSTTHKQKIRVSTRRILYISFAYFYGCSKLTFRQASIEKSWVMGEMENCSEDCNNSLCWPDDHYQEYLYYTQVTYHKRLCRCISISKYVNTQKVGNILLGFRVGNMFFFNLIYVVSYHFKEFFFDNFFEETQHLSFADRLLSSYMSPRLNVSVQCTK